MSALPPALSPWAAQLAPFASDLALAVGGWARRIAHAIGPMSHRSSGAGEPDGVSGLTRRGPYDRLLLSEWLLLQEMPDEFVRRAAASEHLFLETARHRKVTGSRSVALLDAGPDQLGAPRIAQLAVLVVLAARAEAAGVEFGWGIVQAPTAELARGFSADLALRFLEARTRIPPLEPSLGAWRDRLGLAKDGDDLWLVGGAGLARTHSFPEATRLLVEDVVDPSARQVRLVLGTRAAGRRELVLNLPPRADCTRLLRDPFRAAQPTPVRAPAPLASSAGLRFSPSGRRLVLRLANAALLDVQVPSSPRQPAGGHRAIEGGYTIVAVGWYERRPVKAWVRATQLVLERHGSGAAWIAPGPGVPLPVAAGPGEPLGTLLFAPSRSRAWLLDSAGVLFHATYAPRSRGAPTGSLWVASTGVACAHLMGDQVVYVARRGDVAELVADGRLRRETQLLGPCTGRVVVASPRRRLILATEDVDGGTWTVRGAGAALDAKHPHPVPLEDVGRRLRPPSETEVVGVTSSRGEPALVLLEGDRRQFTLLSRHGLRPAFAAASEVESVAVSPAEATVAYVTRAGSLGAWSLDRGTALLQVHGGSRR